MTEIEQLAIEFAKGTNATEDMIYLPVDCIGKIMHIGMRLNREIEMLTHENEKLREYCASVQGKALPPLNDDKLTK